MRKKLTLFLLFVFVVIGSAACSNQSNVNDVDVNVETADDYAIKTQDQGIENELASNLTEEEKKNIPKEMARNNVDFGLYQIKDGWIYGAAPNNGNGTLYFAKRRLEENQWTTLNGCGIVDFDFHNEFIYAILSENEKTPIYKMNLGGSHTEKIIDGKTEYLQVKNDKLYFCLYDENDIPYFTSCNLDGSDIQRILDKEAYYPYTPDGNIVFYQDDNDEETIHKYNMQTKEDVRISSPYAYVPIYDGGNTLFYIKSPRSSTDGEYSGDLIKRNIDTSEEKVLYSGALNGYLTMADGFIYFVNTNDEQRLYAIDINGENIKLISDDAHSMRPIIADDRLIYTVSEEIEGIAYVKDIYCCDLDGSNRFSLLSI